MSKKRTPEKSANTTETAAMAGQKNAGRKDRAGVKKGRGKGPVSRTRAARQGTAETKRTGRHRQNGAGRESKSAKILELIAKPEGATLLDLMQATSWQAHSVRGFLSTAAKKQALKIESTRNENGQRHYHVKA